MLGKSRFFQRWAPKKLRLIDQAAREMSSLVGRAAARAAPAVFRTVRRVMACLLFLAESMRFRLGRACAEPFSKLLDATSVRGRGRRTRPPAFGLLSSPCERNPRFAHAPLR